MTPSAGGVARRYDDMIDGYVCDFADMDQVAGIGAKVTLGQTLMTTLADREALARTVWVPRACCGAGDDTRCLGGGAGEGIHRCQAASFAAADARSSARRWRRRCWRMCWRPSPRHRWPASC
ncbi:MAG: hypothetical protein WDN25_18935 [Acetobacteraceae bacterium]